MSDREDPAQAARCAAGRHFPVECTATRQVMCKHCLEHGICAAVVFDVGVQCPLHQPAQASPALPPESRLNAVCIVVWHGFPWMEVDDVYGLVDLIDDLEERRIILESAALKRLAALCEDTASRCMRYARRPMLSGRFGRRRAQRAQGIASPRQERRQVAGLLGRLLSHCARRLLQHPVLAPVRDLQPLHDTVDHELSKLVQGQALTTRLGEPGV